MKINLYDILSVPAAEKSVEVYLEEQEAVLQGEKIRAYCETPFSVRIKHVQKNEVSVQLEMTASVERSCSRCLESVVKNYTLKLLHMVRTDTGTACTDESGEYDEVSYIEDCTLDVDRLVLDELITVLPPAVLCREDCKGICKVCGANLNRQQCDCDQFVPDPRMAVFGDIFNQLKEV